MKLKDRKTIVMQMILKQWRLDNGGNTMDVPGRAEESHERNSLGIIGILPNIQTESLLNGCTELYRSYNPSVV
jgi:hypothetical protein